MIASIPEAQTMESLTGREDMCAYDKLCSAISVLQMVILSEETTLNAETMFGPSFNMPRAGLELVERLLVEVLVELPGVL